jgi:hypothetical protein
LKTIPIVPYGSTIIFCETKKEYKQKHKELFGDKISLKNNHGKMEGHGESGTYIIWSDSVDFLAHEISHVIFHRFSCLGIATTLENDEVFCYLLSHLMKECRAT